ncbi:hypothetical protein Tco_0715881 [Tanacetum coccineum]
MPVSRQHRSKALYGQKCRSPDLLAVIGDSNLQTRIIIQETTERLYKFVQHCIDGRDRQRSYANVRRKPLEFQVGDRVMLKVSPRKGIFRFGKRGKLNPRYIGPIQNLERIGPVAYKLELPEEIVVSTITFHVFKSQEVFYPTNGWGGGVIPIKELQLDEKLNFKEEPVEVLDRKSNNFRAEVFNVGNEHFMCSTDGQMSLRVILWNPCLRKFYGIDVPFMPNRLALEKIVWGFSVRPDTFPTILNISSLLYEDGPLHVLMYTLSSDTWTVLGNDRLPRLGNLIHYENRYICAWLLEVEVAVVTSWRVLFVIPSQNIAKLLGFTMDDDLIIEVDSGQEMVHTCGAGDVVLRESYQPKTRGKLYYACPKSRPRQNYYRCNFFLWKEERVALLISSPGGSSTPSFSPGTSSTLIFSPTPSTPPIYYGGSSSNTECSNCKHLLGRIKVLQATLEMYMHPEQHTLNSTSLLHELNNDMEKLGLE